MKLKENYKSNVHSAIALLKECVNLNVINKENIKLEKIKAAKKIGIPPFSATVIVIRKKKGIFSVN